MYLKTKYKDITVSYQWRLNGGGLILANEFVHIISRRIGRVRHVFEYCAGPGFIGFSLLAHDLCDQLTLADVNPRAVAAIQETIRNNNLQGRVSVYQSDCLASIPESEQWDLVVGNPPWHLGPKEWKNSMVCDPGGRVHKDFYRYINTFLKPGGTILFVEGGEYTNTYHFKEMIEENRLSITASYRVTSFVSIFKNFSQYPGVNSALIFLSRFCLFFRQVYFISSQRKEGAATGSVHPDIQRDNAPAAVYSRGELIQIARKQNVLCWLLLGFLAAFLLKSTFMGRELLSVFPVFLVIIGFQLLLALRKKWPFMYIIGMIIPKINILIALYLILLSAKITHDNKMNTGLMRAKNIPLDEHVVAL